MRYVVARYKKEQRDMAYRFYVSDSLHFMNQDKYINVRLYDLIHSHVTVDNRTGDEIAIDVINNAGLVVK